MKWHRVGHIRCGKQYRAVWQVAGEVRCARCAAEIEYFVRGGGKGSPVVAVCFRCSEADDSTFRRLQ